MKRTITISKMQAAGNDFVVINDMRRRISSPARLAVKLCHRQFGVGADGLILLQPALTRSAGRYRMRIINSDGSEAEMCGNGSRCAVKMAVEDRIAPPRHDLQTLAGRIHGAYLSKSRVRVGLTPPADFRSTVKIPLANRTLIASFIDTGVPHAVVFVPRIGSVDVNALGREIRTHRVFAPRGANVNFVEIARSGRHAHLRVRTYERGVESETLACGTGATAAAIVAALTRNLRPPIAVRTGGGAVLVIDFRLGSLPDVVTDVTMVGPVERVFEAKVRI